MPPASGPARRTCSSPGGGGPSRSTFASRTGLARAAFTKGNPMSRFVRLGPVVLALVSGLVLAPAVRGDGAIINKKGRYVPEREQKAVIEWHDGQERLYIATRADPAGGPSLWMVPVRASPTQVRAEPVEQLPRVYERGRIVEPALKRLEEAITLTCLLDSGLFPCLSFGGFGGGSAKG